MGLFEYLSWRGDLPFAEYPFNEVDGMVFSRLVYAPFDIVLGDGDIERYGGSKVPEKIPARLLRDVLREILDKEDYKDHLLDPQDEELIKSVIESERYGLLTVSDFIDYISEDEETQFCGMTLHVTGDFNVVVFRGTDDTFLGWKENFNMGFANPLACQVHGLNYLNIVGESLMGDLIVCGHSKGGNISCFAGAFCEYEIQSRITDIYSYDSPGYVDNVLESEGYGRICDRIHTYVPQSSLIGMILGHKEPFIIIHSVDNQVFHQHNLFTWEVEKDHLVREADTTDASKLFDNSLKNWLDAMDKPKRVKFVDGMYALSVQMKLKKLSDVKKISMYERVKQTLAAMKTLDPESREVITEGIRLMFTSYKESRNSLSGKVTK